MCVCVCVCAVRQQHLQVVWLGNVDDEEEEHVVVPGATNKVVYLSRVKTGLESVGMTWSTFTAYLSEAPFSLETWHWQKFTCFFLKTAILFLSLPSR